MLRATNTRLIIEMAKAVKETESGILLQNPLDEKPHAVVVSVGPKVDCGISVGQTIMVDWGRVGKIKFADKDYFVVEQSNVIGVFEE